jgi:hypothetical protein
MSEAIDFIEAAGSDTRREASQNAWRHGMYARKVSLNGEEGAAFAALREALVEQWRPRNVTEWMLVDQLAKQHWRMMRAGDAEADKLGRLSSIDPQRPLLLARTLEAAIGLDVGRDDSSLARLQVFQMRLERSVLRIINQLLALRTARWARQAVRRQRDRQGELGGLRELRARKDPAEAQAGQGDAPPSGFEKGRNENRGAATSGG